MTKTFVPLSDIYALTQWVRFECSQAGLSVQFKDGITGPYTTKNTIVLPTFSDNITVEDAHKLRFFVKHECAHHQYGPAVFKIMESNGVTHETTQLAHVYNAIEDERIERAAARQYRGDAVAIGTGRRLLGKVEVDFLTNALKKDPKLGSASPVTKKLLVLTRMDVQVRDDWDVGTSVAKHDLVRLLDGAPEIASDSRKLEAFDYVAKCRALKNEYESFEFAKQVFEILFEQDADDEIKAAKKRMAERKAASSPADYDRNAKPSDPLDPRHSTSKLDKIVAKSLVLTEHDPGSKSTEDLESSGNGLGLDFTSYVPEDVFKFIPKTHIQVVDFTKVKPSPVAGWSPVKSSRSFAERVRRLIQIQAASRYEFGHKSGKIHNKNLYRWAMPVDVVSPDYRSRIFRRKVESDTLDVCISLLVDCSGSMGGTKFRHAVEAASQMEHAFNRVLRIPVEVLGHTTGDTRGTVLKMYVVKPFNIPVSDVHVSNSFGTCANKLWGNADADAIWFQYDRVLAQKQKRKIMIVLSDGSPADGWVGSDPYYGLRQTVKQIERDASKTGVEIYGVGICDDNVTRYYKHNTVIRNSNELENKLIDMLGSIILKNK